MTIRWAARALLERPNHPRAEEAIDMASFILWSLSGRQFTGIRTVTEVYSTHTAMAAKAEPYPSYLHGHFYNAASDCCCSGCGVFHRIRLRGTPVRRIIKVHVDGRLLQPDEYVLLDHGVLGFLTPNACGAECITVEYMYGFLPPGGADAAALLANELLLASDGEDCNLPQRVTSISRQGVSFTLLDPQDFLKDRRTGIYEIDLLLSAINPSKALMKPRVFSVDIPHAETWKQLPPPPSVAVDPGDQAVLTGYTSTWIVEDRAVRAMVDAGQPLRTQVGYEVRDRVWTPVHGSDTTVSLALPSDATAGILSGDPWAIFGDDGRSIVCGSIAVI